MIWPTDSSKLAVPLAAVLGALLLCLACTWGGYSHGHSTATAKGEAKYARLEKAHADAWAESKAKALDRFVAATQRADKAAAEHITARQRLAENRTETLKEIPHATAGLAACVFGPDFLRVYNRALGLGGSGVPSAAGSGGAAADLAVPRTADARLRTAAPVDASPADLLTHAADYGAWCWGNADQRDNLLKLLTEEAR